MDEKVRCTVDRIKNRIWGQFRINHFSNHTALSFLSSLSLSLPACGKGTVCGKGSARADVVMITRGGGRPRGQHVDLTHMDPPLLVLADPTCYIIFWTLFSHL